jgi:hypothetical protein
VEASWALSAFAAAHGESDTRRDAFEVRTRLLRSFSTRASLFPHSIDSETRTGYGWLRRHVACFADQVYPIQALARHHQRFDDADALRAADACADQICRVQGGGGQWWWHYDARNGAVVEGYPVYSVHQDAMAPMALLDLLAAGGRDHTDAIRRGLGWLTLAPEVQRSLLDDEVGVIWRKVGRTDPRKIVRRGRALSTWIHPSLRLRWLDRIFPPIAIDHECRPYHLGWVLYAWLRTP